MNDRALSPELQRAAAQARMKMAKLAFTVACRRALAGQEGAIEEAKVALAEVNDCRAELARLDSER